MKSTVIRTDREFAELIEMGRRMYQTATGHRITTPKYTEQLTAMMRPLLTLQQIAEAQKGGLRMGRKQG